MSALLIDLDGVIYQGDEALPGAAEAVQWLVEHGIRHLFVTNTTSRPRRDLVTKLEAFGLSIEPREIFTPPVAACTWLHERAVSRVALFVPDATRSEFNDFEHVDHFTAEGVDAVIVGDLGEGWSFEVMNAAFRLLLREPTPHLIALGMTRYWQAADGLRLDTAPFVVALSHASGVQPVVVGKPAPAFFEAALSILGTSASDTYMIGDDIRADVDGAQTLGVRGVLVRTGKFRVDDLSVGIEPHAVLADFAAFPAWWETR